MLTPDDLAGYGATEAEEPQQSAPSIDFAKYGAVPAADAPQGAATPIDFSKYGAVPAATSTATPSAPVIDFSKYGATAVSQPATPASPIPQEQPVSQAGPRPLGKQLGDILPSLPPAGAKVVPIATAAATHFPKGTITTPPLTTPPPQLPAGLAAPNWTPGQDLPEDTPEDFQAHTAHWDTPQQNALAAEYNRQLDAWKAGNQAQAKFQQEAAAGGPPIHEATKNPTLSDFVPEALTNPLLPFSQAFKAPPSTPAMMVRSRTGQLYLQPAQESHVAANIIQGVAESAESLTSPLAIATAIGTAGMGALGRVGVGIQKGATALFGGRAVLAAGGNAVSGYQKMQSGDLDGAARDWGMGTADGLFAALMLRASVREMPAAVKDIGDARAAYQTAVEAGSGGPPETPPSTPGGPPTATVEDIAGRNGGTTVPTGKIPTATTVIPQGLLDAIADESEGKPEPPTTLQARQVTDAEGRVHTVYTKTDQLDPKQTVGLLDQILDEHDTHLRDNAGQHHAGTQSAEPISEDVMRALNGGTLPDWWKPEMAGERPVPPVVSPVPPVISPVNSTTDYASPKATGPRAASIPAPNDTGETHDYSSTQVNMPPSVAEPLQAFGETIPKDELAPDGLDKSSHITLKYGNPGTDPAPIEKALEGQGPITVTLGPLSVFPAEDKKDARGGAGESDVLKVDVDSPDLHKLNKLVGDAVEHTGNTFPEYKPHVTVGYLKPGEGKKYDGQEIPGVTDQQVTFDSVEFSGKDGKKVDIPLNGKPDVTAIAERNSGSEVPQPDTAQNGSILPSNVQPNTATPEVTRSSAAIQKDLDNIRPEPGEHPAHFAGRKGLLTAEYMKALAAEMNLSPEELDARLRQQQAKGKPAPFAGKTIEGKAEPAEVPSVAETPQSAQPQNPSQLGNPASTKEPIGEVPAANPKLPHELAGAKPRYNYGLKAYSLNFANDLDKAAYIAAQKTPSKQDKQYVDFVKQHTGLDEADVRKHGAAIKDAIKQLSKNAPAGTPAKPKPLEVPAHKWPESQKARNNESAKTEEPASASPNAPWQPADIEQGARKYPNLDTFMKVYEEKLRQIVRDNPKEYHYGEGSVPGVVAKMRAAIVRGTYSKDGRGFAATTKALGIKNTYAAIKEFISKQPEKPHEVPHKFTVGQHVLVTTPDDRKRTAVILMLDLRRFPDALRDGVRVRFDDDQTDRTVHWERVSALPAPQQQPSSLKPASEVTEPSSSPAEVKKHILDSTKGKPGGLSIPHLRDEIEASKPEFDNAVLDLYKDGKVFLDKHDRPDILTEAERNALVPDGQGDYYNGITERKAKAEAQTKTAEPETEAAKSETQAGPIADYKPGDEPLDAIEFHAGNSGFYENDIHGRTFYSNGRVLLEGKAPGDVLLNKPSFESTYDKALVGKQSRIEPRAFSSKGTGEDAERYIWFENGVAIPQSQYDHILKRFPDATFYQKSEPPGTGAPVVIMSAKGRRHTKTVGLVMPMKANVKPSPEVQAILDAPTPSPKQEPTGLTPSDEVTGQKPVEVSGNKPIVESEQSHGEAERPGTEGSGSFEELPAEDVRGAGEEGSVGSNGEEDVGGVHRPARRPGAKGSSVQPGGGAGKGSSVSSQRRGSTASGRKPVDYSRDYQLTEVDRLGEGSVLQKAQANLAAIKILKEC